jgi:hypothetical protein
MAVVRKALLACLVLLLTCAGLTAVRQAVRRATARTERIDMLDLMLDVSVFPEEWERCIGPTQQPEHLRPERHASEFWFVGFCPTRSERFEQGIDGAEHDVFRYGNPLEAATVFYGTFLREDFSNRYTASPWSVPEAWSYQSDTADGFRFACAEIESLDLRRRVMTCLTLAQYAEYVSSFSTTLDPEYMTLEQLERVLVAIDERMAQHLGRGE